jgi:predicted nucleic acid-binding protein
MSEIAFLLDASALARIFYDDIGKTNLENILNYPGSILYTPEIGIIETISALLAACNSEDISIEEYTLAVSTLYNMVDKGELNVLSLTDDYVQDCISILEQYKTKPDKGFNGMDAIYILVSRMIAHTVAGANVTVVFVTSDTKLYNACQEEPSFKTFHFWTCDLGCGHIEHIPKKFAKKKPARYAKCNNCGSQVRIEEDHESSNRCPICGKLCPDCSIDVCPSTYSIDFRRWS